MRLRADDAGVVDTNLKYNGYDNLFVCDPGVSNISCCESDADIGSDVPTACGSRQRVAVSVPNLFEDMPDSLPEELVDVLTENKSVRIERIVSTGHSSQDEFWYDQEEHEWVVVLKGEAKLLFEGDDQPVLMKPGDYLNIPAHQKHRVEWTTPKESTVWLAVFYRDA